MMNKIKILSAAFLMASYSAYSGVSVYDSQDKTVPSLLDIKNDNMEVVATFQRKMKKSKNSAVTYIKKPLSEIIEAYFPEWKVNNISRNRNILKTVVTVIPGKSVITSKNILKNIFTSINKHLDNKLTFKVHETNNEIFIIDLVGSKQVIQ